MPPRHHKKPEKVKVEITHNQAEFWLQQMNVQIGLSYAMLRMGEMDHATKRTAMDNLEKMQAIREAIMKGKWG